LPTLLTTAGIEHCLSETTPGAGIQHALCLVKLNYLLVPVALISSLQSAQLPTNLRAFWVELVSMKQNLGGLFGSMQNIQKRFANTNGYGAGPLESMKKSRAPVCLSLLQLQSCKFHVVAHVLGTVQQAAAKLILSDIFGRPGSLAARAFTTIR